MLVRALDVVFPPRCAGCGTGSWPFCQGCLEELEALGPPWCERCGRPGPIAVQRCRDCPPPSVSVARSPFLYAGSARAAIHRLKFSGWRSVAAALADAMVAVGPPTADAVTWVPLARRRLAERGYDQARALAGAVGGRLGLPVLRLTRRSVATAPQARRPGDERRVAMHGAFEPIHRPAPVPRRVILVDDVLTTGATAAACADALASAGVHEIVVLTAARAFTGGGRRYTRTGSQPGLWLPGDLPR
ncbi:MAG: ComF family protein [Actinomycetota bacterium]